MPRDWLSLFHTQLDDPNMQDFITNIEGTIDDYAGDILRLVIQDVLAYLRSFTNRTNPPRSGYTRKYQWELDPETSRFPGERGFRGKKLLKAEREGQRRPAHPGNWSDVSGVMADSYYGKITKLSTGDWSGIIGNRDPDAVYVEAKLGYFVVTGVFRPNGPVMRALAKYVRMYAPGSKILHTAAAEAQAKIQEGGKTLGIIEGVVVSPPGE